MVPIRGLLGIIYCCAPSIKGFVDVIQELVEGLSVTLHQVLYCLERKQPVHSGLYQLLKHFEEMSPVALTLTDILRPLKYYTSLSCE